MRWIGLVLLLIEYGRGTLVWNSRAGPRGPIILADNEADFRIGKDFDYLLLTRIYPVAMCRADDDAEPGSCVIPNGDPQWSIHGLWPNYMNGSYPQFCDGIPKKFDEDLLQPIHEELAKQWPSYYPKHPVHGFWAHEWEKHGTCAESLPLLDSEVKYFNSTIDLNSRFNITSALEKGGLRPSMKPLNRDHVQKIFDTYIGHGKHVHFTCLKDKKLHESLLGDVRMCVDKFLQLMDCPAKNMLGPITNPLGFRIPLPSFHPCPETFYYLPNNIDQEEDLSVVYRRFQPSGLYDKVLRIAGNTTTLFVVVVILFGLLIAVNQRIAYGKHERLEKKIDTLW